jgi:prepilin-type N-terminal cleavage/methylation domain-containing protein/prepilin-type processing-associated H-X9-DG protein
MPKTEYSILDARRSKTGIDKNGFTIVELLVVISIIAAIMAILLPGLNRARAIAKRTRCASNLKQIDVAMHSYLSSNDDKYPCAQDKLPKQDPADPNIWLWQGRGWRSFIAPHLRDKINAKNPSVLLCPSDKVAPVKWESTSYSYSLAFYHSPEDIDSLNGPYSDLTTIPATAQKTVNVAKPAGKILVGEWLSNHHQDPNDNSSGWWSGAGKRNYLFADGQVRFLDAKDIKPARDDNPNPNLTIHGIRGIDWLQ